MCIKISYSLSCDTFCFILIERGGQWRTSISHCWDRSPSALWNESSVLAEYNCLIFILLVLVGPGFSNILSFGMQLCGALPSWEVDMEKLGHV